MFQFLLNEEKKTNTSAERLLDVTGIINLTKRFKQNNKIVLTISYFLLFYRFLLQIMFPSIPCIRNKVEHTFWFLSRPTYFDKFKKRKKKKRKNYILFSIVKKAKRSADSVKLKEGSNVYKHWKNA